MTSWNLSGIFSPLLSGLIVNVNNDFSSYDSTIFRPHPLNSLVPCILISQLHAREARHQTQVVLYSSYAIASNNERRRQTRPLHYDYVVPQDRPFQNVILLIITPIESSNQLNCVSQWYPISSLRPSFFPSLFWQ